MTDRGAIYKERCAVCGEKSCDCGKVNTLGNIFIAGYPEEVNKFYSDIEEAEREAILAALPDMIKPLEWEGGAWHILENEGWIEEAKDHCGNWYCIEDQALGFSVSQSTDEGWSCSAETPDEAKAAANAHHRAAIMSAFGVGE